MGGGRKKSKRGLRRGGGGDETYCHTSPGRVPASINPRLCLPHFPCSLTISQRNPPVSTEKLIALLMYPMRLLLFVRAGKVEGGDRGDGGELMVFFVLAG